MINYTKRNVVTITLIIVLLIYSLISVILSYFSNSKKNTPNETEEVVVEETQENKVVTEEKILENVAKVWQIKIPKIDLVADIQEGTSLAVMANYVGHFNNTATTTGNIGLAAHNRGIGVESYFKNIKNLQVGDQIVYQKDDFIKKYKVTKNTIISETDWTYLINTKDNRITLITCVENKPEYRRCVQAVEIKE